MKKQKRQFGLILSEEKFQILKAEAIYKDISVTALIKSKIFSTKESETTPLPQRIDVAPTPNEQS